MKTTLIKPIDKSKVKLLVSCCNTMVNQLTARCNQHHYDCPDNVVTIGHNSGKLYLTAPNADYWFEFCPWCGKKIPQELSAR